MTIAATTSTMTAPGGFAPGNTAPLAALSSAPSLSDASAGATASDFAEAVDAAQTVPVPASVTVSPAPSAVAIDLPAPAAMPQQALLTLAAAPVPPSSAEGAFPAPPAPATDQAPAAKQEPVTRAANEATPVDPRSAGDADPVVALPTTAVALVAIAIGQPQPARARETATPITAKPVTKNAVPDQPDDTPDPATVETPPAAIAGQPLPLIAAPPVENLPAHPVSGDDQAALTPTSRKAATAKQPGVAAAAGTNPAPGGVADQVSAAQAKPADFASAITGSNAVPPKTAQDSPVITARAGTIGREMGVEIARRVSAGGQELTIRLDPVEMGRIEVRLSFDDRGSLRAVVAADSPVALEMLRRDTADLGRALADAGVRADARSFQFDSRSTGGGSSGQGSPRQPQHHAGRGYTAADPANDDLIYRPLRASGRVDLLA